MSTHSTQLRVTVVLAMVIFGACSDQQSVQGTSAPWELSEIGRIGAADGEGTALWGVVGAVWLDSTLYVLEVLTPRVARFTASGEWLNDFAPMGDGPGEVRRPREIGTAGDRIWVGDPAGARLEVYSSQGEPLQSLRFDILPDSLGARAFPLALLSDGSVLAGPGQSFNIAPIIRGYVTHANYYRATPSGEVLGLVCVVPFPEGDYFQGRIAEERQIVGGHPLPQMPLVSAFPDGSGIVAVERWVSESAEDAFFQVRVWDADGSLEVEASVPYVPTPGGDWLDRRVEQVRAAQAASVRGVDEPALVVLRESLADRPYFPPVTALRPGIDGSIWVRREETSADSVEWLVLDRRGRALGRVATPTNLSLLTATLDEVWAVERDESDVEYVIQYRVVR